MFAIRSYFSATRHPWACILFVLPLLLAYEAGVLSMGPEQPELLRNGADAKKLQAEIWEGQCPQCWTACEAYQTILGNVLAGRTSPPRSHVALQSAPRPSTP